MDCLVSRAGYYDLFQKINNKFVVFNTNEFNCHLNSNKIEFSHISGFVFKLLFLNYTNLISFIMDPFQRWTPDMDINSDDEEEESDSESPNTHLRFFKRSSGIFKKR